MTKIFEAQTDGVIYMDADAADLQAGGLIKWNDVSSGGKTPSGFTWNKSAAAEMLFKFSTVGNDTYKMLIRVDTSSIESWLWMTIDGQTSVLGQEHIGRVLFQTSTDTWVELTNTFTLLSGYHTITLHSLSDSIDISRVAVMPTSNTTLSGGATAFGSEAVCAGSAAVVDNQTYVEWLEDETRDPVRALLLEIDHDGGTIRVGSDPYLSNKHLAYDDGVISDPYIEESMDGDVLVGDVELVVEDPDYNYGELNFHGYPCRWLFGDQEWDIDQFRTITTNTIETCKQTGLNKFQFDLVPASDIYDTTFYTGEDETRTETISDAITWLLASFVGSSSLEFINVDPATILKSITYTVTESTTVDSVLTLICDCLGGFYRTTQDGDLEIVVPDVNNNAAINFNSNNILAGSISETEIIPPKSRVTVTYGVDDESVTVETEAVTGSFDDELVVDTAFTTLADATTRAYELADQYSRSQKIYSFDVVDLVDVVMVGDYCTINSLLINTTGVVQTIRRTPLTAASTIEVIV